MYWFNVKALERDLKTGRLSEWDRCCYAVALFTFLGFITLLGRYVAVRFSVMDFVASLLDIGVYATGIMMAYYTNAAGDNKAFLDRLLPLYWVISVRVILSVAVLCILISMLLWIFLHVSLIHIAQQPTFLIKIGELVITLGTSVWLWSWIYVVINRISTR